MKHTNITVLSISDSTGTHAPSAGANGTLGQLALQSEVKTEVNNLSAALQAQIDSISAAGAASNFTDLNDAPSSYTGQAGNLVQVNPSETGLQFTNFVSGSILCNTMTATYVVTDAHIFASSNPIVTVVGPSANSAGFTANVFNVQNGQFTIILSGTPDEPGFKLNWLIL
jgi:hypothetical protein